MSYTYNKVLALLLTALLVLGPLSSTALADSGAEAPVQVPVLIYHHICEDPQNSSSISPERFEEHLAALAQDGYTAISFSQLIIYAATGAPLPEKPIIITFDDGYSSNLEIAAPLLYKYGMCATVNVIGWAVGNSVYRGVEVDISPHFSFEEALPWINAGVIELGSHSFDMHQSSDGSGGLRSGVYPQGAEKSDPALYEAALRADFTLAISRIQENTGRPVSVFAYPYGYHTALSEQLLLELGVPVTLGVREGVNNVSVGDADSLRLMSRIWAGESMSGTELILRLGLLGAAARLEAAENVS